jgi:hypothetical protein
VVSSIVGLLRLASIVICVIVIASFAIFVVDQSKSASSHQAQEITVKTNSAHSTQTSGSKEGSVHRAIDEASEQLTSPFAGVISGSSSEWVIRGVKLLLALAVYGFGLGFVARALRVRV